MRNHMEDIFKFTKKTYWTYDNGWSYENKSWDAYSGPYFSNSNHLVMLHNTKETIILHYINNQPIEVWRGCLDNKSDFNNLLIKIEEYRKNYCLKNKIDPERDIEHNLICLQNGQKPSYKRLKVNFD